MERVATQSQSTHLRLFVTFFFVSYQAGATATATATATADGWTNEECEILVKLVEDATFRKAQTGKKKLKWSKIADNIGKHKKESKKKYTLLTGKEAPESE